ncbi:MAG: DUF4350 domain-containing protein [Crocinitomicaceae bacterium]
MSKTGKIGIIAGAVVLFTVILYFVAGRGEETYVSDNWLESYQPNDKGPYGTYVLKELLDTQDLFGNFLELNSCLEESLEDDPDINDIYFFVGGKNYLTDSSTNYLMDFVAAGNTAFIATESFPYELRARLFYDADWIFNEDIYDSTLYLKFEHPDLSAKRYQFDYIYNNELSIHIWKTFDTEEFLYVAPDTLETLGATSKNEVNFVKLSIGDGALFLISTPYVFTNVAMMRRDGFQYAENVLRHVPPGRVQWDRYSLDYYYESNSSDGEGGGNNGQKRESILQFITNNPPLFWAFIVLVVAAILYALFKGKRMQRIVPATESRENTSLQYINTLSSLYLQEKKHRKLVRLMEKTFLNFIANRYYIHTQKINDKFIDKLVLKSQVSREELEHIFETFDQLQRQTVVSDEELVSLYKLIENFYKTCR